MSEHMHEPTPIQAERWSWWDVAGLAFYTTGMILDKVDTGLRSLAAMCAAQAAYSRDRQEEREAEWAAERERQIMARALDEGRVDWSPEDLT